MALYCNRLTLPLDGYDARGCKVVIVRSAMHNTSTTSMDEVLKASNMIGPCVEDDEQWSVTGIVQVIDLAGATASHGMQMTPAFVKKAMVIWQVGCFQYDIFLSECVHISIIM